MKPQPPELVGEYFTIYDSALQGRTLSVSGPWNSAVEAALTEFDVDSVSLNYALGYSERSLDFLHSGLNIRKLSILSRTTVDISPVYRLASTLQYLSIEVSTRSRLDLALLPQIQTIRVDWSLIKDSVAQVEDLRIAVISRYAGEDLRPIGMHLGLVSLELDNIPKIRTLSGIEFLPSLSSLGIYGARTFTDMSQLRELAPNLIKEIQIESCKSVGSLEALQACQGLEFLNIGNLGPIDSLTPLRTLKLLKRLYAYESTMIIDGDLSPLADLPHLRQLKMMNRKSYTPSVAKIMEVLGASE
ncbi:hypothetical protein [Subtercola vilae]|uniref:Leucine-rich repeat domain-containing protein n=1 Tax=Subtercola vilae TaxID=2056433 RepID=A0A4T2BE97_9MICO|nr:hypothetical protein [Subtercola vilae]TIH27368.1 hypothetical protein D4765_18565 [Subtercola vilae]